MNGELLQLRAPYKPQVEDLREDWLVTQLRFLQLLQPLLNSPDQDLKVRHGTCLARGAFWRTRGGNGLEFFCSLH